MSLEIFDTYRDSNHMHEVCKRCMSFHAIITMVDGSTCDGIIEDVDKDCVIVLVGEDVMDDAWENQMDQQRQPFGHGRPRRRFRRFRRRSFPLNTLAALALLRYPYIAPPYPYYNPYYPY